MAAMQSYTRSGVSQFRRHECKYVITEDLAAKVRASMRPFVDPDPHTAGSPDGAYDIASLYLDAPDLKLFWESQEGLCRRVKLRIRYYHEVDSAFLEIKRRRDRLVLKGRARLPRAAIAVILAGGCPDVSGLRGDQRACYEEFTGHMDRWMARPAVWVRYRREAYVGAYHPGVRVTMDRRLVCAPADEMRGDPDFSDDFGRWRSVEERRVVLELKFDNSYPSWMARLVRRFELQRRSYSKYCRSVCRGLDPEVLSPIDAWSVPRTMKGAS